MADDFSPVYFGDTLTPLTVQVVGPGGAPITLTGLTITMKMEFLNDPNNVKEGSGSWVIDDAVNGKAHYNWAPADVDTIGIWVLFVKVTDGGGKFVHLDTKEFQILPAQ